MREGNRRRAGRRVAIALAGLLGLLWLAVPALAAPINDDYLNSLRLNNPGTRLNRTDTLRDVRDTTGATVQTNMLSPMPGGPAEPTTCQGVNYGATVWYDFHPDVSGLVRLRTSGYDNVISLMPFDTTTLIPDLAARQCVPNLSAMTEELDAPVLAGKHYTVQIGGVKGATGTLEFLFDFVPQIARISADATLIAQALTTGIRDPEPRGQRPPGDPRRGSLHQGLSHPGQDGQGGQLPRSRRHPARRRRQARDLRHRSERHRRLHRVPDPAGQLLEDRPLPRARLADAEGHLHVTQPLRIGLVALLAAGAFAAAYLAAHSGRSAAAAGASAVVPLSIGTRAAAVPALLAPAALPALRTPPPVVAPTPATGGGGAVTPAPAPAPAPTPAPTPAPSGGGGGGGGGGGAGGGVTLVG